jgi:hypothetical protein
VGGFKKIAGEVGRGERRVPPLWGEPRLGLLAEGGQLAYHLRGARIGTHPPDVLEAPPGAERVEQPRFFHAADKRAGSRRVGQIEEVVGEVLLRLHELFFSAFLDTP